MYGTYFPTFCSGILSYYCLIQLHSTLSFYFCILSRIYSDILSGILSGIYSDDPFWYSNYSIWHSIWHFIVAFFVAFYVPFYVTFYSGSLSPFVFTFSLNSILPDLNQEHQISPGSLGPVVPTKIWSSGLGSGSVYWDLGFAVRSSSAHWDLKLAVEVRQVPIEICWGPRRKEEGRKEVRKEDKVITSPPFKGGVGGVKNWNISLWGGHPPPHLEIFQLKISGL